MYSNCTQCPRNCGVNRTNSSGYCGESDKLKIAVACLHFGEEPLLTVHGGSGTIFITGCTLRCAFCQNYQISQQGMGKEVSKDEFAQICLKLQEIGAENINIVTGSHHIPVIADYLRHAKTCGLNIPIAWNSSAYESVQSLELLKGVCDIYLPDLKTLNPMMSKELFGAENYPTVAKKAIRWMIQNAPMNITEITKDGQTREKINSGVIIRHLFLPGRLEDTQLTLEWLKNHADGKSCISLMSQYTPVQFVESSNDKVTDRYKKLECFQNRLVNQSEDDFLKGLVEAYDFEYLFYQDLCADTEWLPDFTKTQPFSYALAKPVWHWNCGFVE